MVCFFYFRGIILPSYAGRCLGASCVVVSVGEEKTCLLWVLSLAPIDGYPN